MSSFIPGDNLGMCVCGFVREKERERFIKPWYNNYHSVRLY